MTGSSYRSPARRLQTAAATIAVSQLISKTLLYCHCQKGSALSGGIAFFGSVIEASTNLPRLIVFIRQDERDIQKRMLDHLHGQAIRFLDQVWL